MDTKKITNKDIGIVIGNHVWIARRSMILKGVTIPDNSIISSYTLVNKRFVEQNTIIAGIPAKVVKRQINWNFCPSETYGEYFTK